MLALLLAQATAAEPLPADTPERFSVLVQPCAVDGQDISGDVVVCAKADQLAPRLPSTADREPDGPTPSNPEMTGAGALAASATPCHVRMEGCTVGFGPPIMPLVKGAVGLVKSAFASHPDKAGRVPIPLDAAPLPDAGGRVLP